MKVLVVGGGGREHALAWSLSRSPRVSKLFCAPGNAGIAQIADCIDIDANDFDRLVSFAKEVGVDLTVVGPEDPLCNGIVDRFESEGLRVFGPKKDAAEIEGSKIFSKRLMARYMIPTATGRPFDECDRALRFVEGADFPLVIKADGLAAGKGVTVARSVEEATAALEAAMVDKRFGAAGGSVLIEDYLQGEEASVLAFTDGKTIAILPSARDYKRAFDADEGPNTGGMGSYSPTPACTDAILDQVVGQILVPFVHAMNKEGRTFRGILYTGLMITKGGPKVVEFNCRFGDPEAQAVLMRLKTDLVDVIDAVLESRLDEIELEFDPRHACCVVLASKNYPESSPLGLPISGLDGIEASDDLQVFHGGTAQRGDEIVTAGGRILGVTALGDDLAGARKRAYEAASGIQWEGARMRSDIGA
ncbi:MAG: phosphoribosylamine--glycine ligase [Planctomycetota bacterium]|nr:phosphoribosylamine--glycine ligase [Planctomycetota bacterium]